MKFLIFILILCLFFVISKAIMLYIHAEEENIVFQENIEIKNLNFKKIRKLYGILKSIETVNYKFEITNENKRFKIRTCSFLVLLSMCGISDTFTIVIWGENAYKLKTFSQEIQKIS